MNDRKAVVVACDMVTPYGWGIDTCWKGLLSSTTAINKLERFPTESFQSENAAVIPDLSVKQDYSLVMQMLTSLFKQQPSTIPTDTLLILASTTGEIDILEKNILNGDDDASQSRLDNLLNKVKHLVGIGDEGMIVSAACASSSIAIAEAAAIINNGERDCVLVVACDSVSEFVFAGFSSLMALDKNKARPFDKHRNGLSIGEAAGFALIMSKSRALREKRNVMGEISGWGLTNDANHMTGPSRDGDGLARAINKALQSASIPKDAIGCVAAHGTGTVYNDAMEMRAVKSVFQKMVVPLYSIKGGIGHTMGAAGLTEMIVALRSLKERIIPPTVNLRTVDDDGNGWVFSESRRLNSETVISTNSGFGGVNVALVLRGCYGEKKN